MLLSCPLVGPVLGTVLGWSASSLTISIVIVAVGVLLALLYRAHRQLAVRERAVGNVDREHQATLQASEARYRLLAESSPIAVLLLQDEKVVFANKAAANSAGLNSVDELIGVNPLDFVMPRDREMLRERMQRRFRGELSLPDRFVLTMQRADGTTFRAEHHVSMVTFDGRPAEQLCSVDLARRDEAREELLESQERLRLAMEATHDGIWDRNLVTGESYFSPRWFTMLGYEPGELAASHDTWLELLHPDDRENADRKVDELIAGETDSFESEFRLRTRSGKWKWILSRARAARRDESGRALRLVGTHVDITERRRMEAERERLHSQIMHTQKLEGLGVLAGGVAHDFNNLLTSILGNASLVLEDLPADSSLRSDLEDVVMTSRQAAGLCRQLLAYSGKGAFMIEPVDFSILIEEMAYLLAVSVSKKAELSYNLNYELPAVEIDPVQARQIVLNLATNASEAIGDKRGQIAVSTGKKTYTREKLAVTYLKENLEPGEYVFFEITDTGCGMDEKARMRIFDPFFTTKFHGRGLGLAAVLGVVRSHGGAIVVTSEPGRGSTFRLLFPSSDKPPRQHHVLPVSEDLWQVSGSILIVDDEDSVRRTAQRMLERAGFDVIIAGDGLEAIDIVRAGDHQIKAVLLDLTMPRMGGDEALRPIRELRPDIKIVLSSGYDVSDPRNRALHRDYDAFLQKPYSRGQLIAAVRNVLTNM